MRVVCPVVHLDPLTKRSLESYAPQAELIDLGAAHDAYYTLIARLWGEGDTFLLVEHDIEIHASVISQLEKCVAPWCLFPYSGPSNGEGDPLLYGSLGCTRFSDELLTALPNFMVELPVRNWKHLDAEITPRLKQAGYEPHLHWPIVLHHHVRENGRCDCGGSH